MIAAFAGWLGYYYFLKPDRYSAKAENYYFPNSCWIYHEYVYRVDFRDKNLKSFFFIRNNDGTFSPSRLDSSGNLVTGNGFIVDPGGACVTTRKMYQPWELSDGQSELLKDLIDKWLDMQEGPIDKTYKITGQTVALFVVLSNPKQLIEYTNYVNDPGVGQYGVIYPEKKINLRGIKTDYQHADKPAYGSSTTWRVLNTTFDENPDVDVPHTRTASNDITATLTQEGYLDNITVQKGDEYFSEGSSLFNSSGHWMGILHYQNKRWQLASTLFVTPVLRNYESNQIIEDWEYNQATSIWRRIFKKQDDELTKKIKGDKTSEGMIDSVKKTSPQKNPDYRLHPENNVEFPFKKQEGWEILEQIDNLHIQSGELINTRSTMSFFFNGELGRCRIKMKGIDIDSDSRVVLYKWDKESGQYIRESEFLIGRDGVSTMNFSTLYFGKYYIEMVYNPVKEHFRLVFEKFEN